MKTTAQDDTVEHARQAVMNPSQPALDGKLMTEATDSDRGCEDVCHELCTRCRQLGA